ncbi:MAG TPA: acyltransferase family protein [Acidimicrobiales bacterium]
MAGTPNNRSQPQGPPAQRLLASGDESGTAPEDRPFRPDVEGLRAVAVLLVVLYHSGISALSGGYIGVDVFFVISGFVITGVLLRERVTSGRTSVLAFYGRRCRRIIPAATVVIIITVVLSYFLLGLGTGSRTASDGRWASVFLANVHFSAVGTDYLRSQQPPSPLQNYWSLSVEEQFYVVYPTLFLVLAGIRTRFSLRARLTAGLLIIIAASLAFSVIDTASNATIAYFSPFTRAWELALGALVAVATPWLKAVPSAVAAIASWLGLGAVLYAAFAFDAKTAYPGSIVTVPVVGAALIIAGGVTAGALGAEAVLGLAPLRLIGKLSYSLYLWHWPILILAAEYAGRTSLSVPQNLAWDVVALLASVITYVVVENPIRHAKPLLRVRWASIGLGVALVAVSLGAITVQADAAGSSRIVAKNQATPKAASAQDLLALVAASPDMRTIPSNLVPPFSQLVTRPESDIGFPPVSSGCRPSASQSRVPTCVFGDRTGAHTMVLYGDSHAGMWFVALDDIAKQAHWRLIVLFKPACPASPLATHALGSTGPWVACEQWQRFAIARVNQIDPDLLIVSQASYYTSPKGVRYTPAQWQHGLAQLLAGVTAPKTKSVVLGNIPSSEGPDCLARHSADIRACATSPHSALTPYNDAEARAAVGRARYVDVTPWFCAKTCSAVVGRYDVYLPGGHVAVGYSRFIEGVLASALGLPTSTGTVSLR